MKNTFALYLEKPRTLEKGEKDSLFHLIGKWEIVVILRKGNGRREKEGGKRREEGYKALFTESPRHPRPRRIR